MSDKVSRWFECAFKDTENNVSLGEAQKDAIYARVMARRDLRTQERRSRFGEWVSNYPWRFAFGLSALQAAACTLIWGAGYARLFLLSWL